jgi:hypothetical protein
MKKRKKKLSSQSMSVSSLISSLTCLDSGHIFMIGGAEIPEGWPCLCGLTYYQKTKDCQSCGQKLP